MSSIRILFATRETEVGISFEDFDTDRGGTGPRERGLGGSRTTKLFLTLVAGAPSGFF